MERAAVGTIYTARYRAELSPGRACVYADVVRRSACPSVVLTRWIGAPRSSAWLAWAWRSQWGDTAAAMPARLAAARTMRHTCVAVRAPPWRERNTGASGPPRPSPSSSCHVAAESSTKYLAV